MSNAVEYSIFSLILFVIFTVPGVYEVQADDTPSVSEFVNCVSFFSRIHRVRENDCKWYEFEVTVEGGGAQGPPGPAGPPGPPGDSGAGTIEIVQSTEPFTINCASSDEDDLLAFMFAECPEGSAIMGVDCKVDPPVPVADDETAELILIGEEQIFDGNNTFAPLGSIFQFASCILACSEDTMLEGDINGILTVKAFCSVPQADE